MKPQIYKHYRETESGVEVVILVEWVMETTEYMGRHLHWQGGPVLDGRVTFEDGTPATLTGDERETILETLACENEAPVLHYRGDWE